jgi:transcriptional regulator with XRE-family HTH domain
MDRALPTQSIHKIFAENLRRQTERFASIAELCRLTGINRPQFNRYLSGQNLPNPRTMARLCAVLGLPEVQLFQMPGGGLNLQGGKPDADQVATALEQAGLADYAVLLRAATINRPVEILAGFYHLYVPHPQDEVVLLRLAVKISRDRGLVRFTRHTVVKDARKDGPGMAIGRHRGLVVADDEALVMVGMNRIFPYEFSVVRVINGIGLATAPRGGLAVLRTPEFNMGCRICLDWCGNGLGAGKRALRGIGVVRLDDASVSAEVRAMMGNPAKPASGRYVTSGDHGFLDQLVDDALRAK